MKIIFFGTPRFGAIVLEKLANTEYKPVLVVTEPDKPAGRKQELKSSEVKIAAQKYNIPIEQPEKIKNLESSVLKIECDLIIVAAYGQILPKEILNIPKFGCLNIHPSLLPKYRGPAPIQTAILNGDEETGTSIILMDELIDHGSIISNQNLPLRGISRRETNYQTLETELAEKGAKLLLETIPDWVKGKIKAKPQDETKATYTKIIKKEDGKIDWKKSAEKIEAQIRAFHFWPCAFTFWEKNDKKELRIKILKAEVLKESEKKNLPLGKIFVSSKNEIAVKCGTDSLAIKELQIEGKKPCKIQDFIKGNPDFLKATLI